MQRLKGPGKHVMDASCILSSSLEKKEDTYVRSFVGVRNPRHAHLT